ncbi:hypothetical protein OFL47_16645, partial [Pseudomonas aeruginosa]|nr:hypothetical protein [Pseudomonas aeruginosa]
MKRLLIPLLVLGALFLGGCSSLLFYPEPVVQITPARAGGGAPAPAPPRGDPQPNPPRPPPMQTPRPQVRYADTPQPAT